MSEGAQAISWNRWHWAGWKIQQWMREENGLSYHEVRYAPGVAEANQPLEQVIVYVDDAGVTYYPSDPDYVAPEPDAFEFLQDFGTQLSEDKERIDQGAVRDQQQIESTEAALSARIDDSPQAQASAARDQGAVVGNPMPAPRTENIEDAQPAPTRVPAPSAAETQPMPPPQSGAASDVESGAGEQAVRAHGEQQDPQADPMLHQDPNKQ